MPNVQCWYSWTLYCGWNPDIWQRNRFFSPKHCRGGIGTSHPKTWKQTWFCTVFQCCSWVLILDSHSKRLIYSINLTTLMLTYVFFSFIFLWVFVYMPPLRGQHTVLCHLRWLPTSGLTEFAVCWGGAGFEPRTTDLQSGALPLSHLSSRGGSMVAHLTAWKLSCDNKVCCNQQDNYEYDLSWNPGILEYRYFIFVHEYQLRTLNKKRWAY